jgi:hypothetical protein
MILSTVPGMVKLGCSGIRAVSRFGSAILADLADLLPEIRTKLNMISEIGKGEEHVEEQAQRGADDRGAEAARGGAEGGGCGAGSGGVQAHDLRLEGEVRRDGCEPGAGGEAVAGREHTAAEAGGGSESGQGSAAVSDSKKRLELVARKAAVEQVR